MRNRVPTETMLRVSLKASDSPVEAPISEIGTFVPDSEFQNAVKLLEAYYGKASNDAMVYA